MFTTQLARGASDRHKQHGQQKRSAKGPGSPSDFSCGRKGVGDRAHRGQHHLGVLRDRHLPPGRHCGQAPDVAPRRGGRGRLRELDDERDHLPGSGESGLLEQVGLSLPRRGLWPRLQDPAAHVQVRRAAVRARLCGAALRLVLREAVRRQERKGDDARDGGVPDRCRRNRATAPGRAEDQGSDQPGLAEGPRRAQHLHERGVCAVPRGGVDGCPQRARLVCAFRRSCRRPERHGPV
mmetsp:Transcript_4778/g.19137  ORF Transcript_4778/g.19137 Transcript_4778/m.19137 type:complete len:237 (-) Transcript_4778:407-1117(-)